MTEAVTGVKNYLLRVRLAFSVTPVQTSLPLPFTMVKQEGFTCFDRVGE